MATRQRRRAPTRRRTTRRNPIHRPRARRKTTTKRGMVRRTARRAYTPRSNPIRRRRAARRNPAQDVLGQGLAVAAGAALGQFTIEMLVNKPISEGNKPIIGEELGKRPELVQVGLGALIAVLSDQYGKKQIKKFGPAVGYGMIAVGIGQMVSAMIAKKNAETGLPADKPGGALYGGGTGADYRRIAERDIRAISANENSAADQMAGLYQGSVSNIF